MGKSFLKCLPQILKYQIVTKLIIALLVFPIWSLSSGILVSSTDLGALTNTNFFNFIFSSKGAILIILKYIVIILGVTLEICGFITISARSLHDQPEVPYGQLLKNSLKLMPKMSGIGGLIIVLYSAVLTPLTGIGTKVSFFNQIKIPNFIASVIHSNLALNITYGALLAILTAVSFFMFFTFHFMVLHREKAMKAIGHSMKMVKANFKHVLLKNVKVLAILAIVSTAIIGIFLALFLIILAKVDMDTTYGRGLAILIVIIQSGIMLLVQMFVVPFEIHFLTVEFYMYTEEDDYDYSGDLYPVLQSKVGKSLLDRILTRRKTIILVALLVALGISFFVGKFFDDIFRNDRNIQVVSHRAGGNMAPENSVAGLEKAIEKGAQFAEIDIQRTEDGSYVLNHDKDFKRSTGDPRTSLEMSVADAKELQIESPEGYEGKPQTVATIEEAFTAAKGKIGLFVELKGDTADFEMAEDIIKMAKNYDMLDKTVLVSLDYDLISQIEEKYPSVNTGYIYFLAVGDVSGLKCDYLIMEEINATNDMVEKIHNSDKKAIVWTVNNFESMSKFANSEVDGIITDDVVQMKQVLNDRKTRSAKDILLDMFLQKKGSH